TTGGSIERVESTPRREEDSPGTAVRPIRDASVNVRVSHSIGEWIETPHQDATLGAQRNDGKRWRGGVENAVYYRRCCLNLGVCVGWSIASVINPSDTELRNIAAVDLIERGIVGISRFAFDGAQLPARDRSSRLADGTGERYSSD
ncbi:MAG: hypothetical protein ACJ8AJ_03580, partial [Gemmatimonadaceae bacterium]